MFWLNLAHAGTFMPPDGTKLAEHYDALYKFLLWAAFIFLLRLVDLFWLIVPAFYPNEIHIHWLDIVVPITLGGGWIALLVRQLARKPLLPLHDPHLQEIVEHEQKEFVSP